MQINDVINNVHIYGMDNAFRGSKFSYAVDLNKITVDKTKTIETLAQSPTGSGHDNFLNGIIVQFDLTLTNKCWVEAQRYHFLDFISSQSTMHRITKFDLDQAYISYVDPRVVEIMKEKVAQYNQEAEWLKNETDSDKRAALVETMNTHYLEILYTNPAGFRITAYMTTNYRQLKTIYHQRRNHRLPEWQAFCDWVETLPNSELITVVKTNA